MAKLRRSGRIRMARQLYVTFRRLQASPSLQRQAIPDILRGVVPQDEQATVPAPNASQDSNLMAGATTAYLVIRRDDGFGDVFPLVSGQNYTLGRSAQNNVVLKDDLCSREHA